MNARTSNRFGSHLSNDTVASVSLLAAAILVVLSAAFAGLTEGYSPAVPTSAEGPQDASRA